MQNKNSLLIISILIVAAILFVVMSNNNPRNSEITETSVATENTSDGVTTDANNMVTVVPYILVDGIYTFDVDRSKLNWSGNRPLIDKYVDNGTVMLKEGSVEVKDKVVSKANLVIDLTTINATDIARGEGQDMLSKHLKSADFFEVEKYPTAQYEVTSVEDMGDGNYKVNGKLTIKEFTEEVSVDVKAMQNSDESVSLIGSLKIDRTKFGLKYQSGQFFKDLGEKLIDDNFDLKLDLVAVPNK